MNEKRLTCQTIRNLRRLLNGLQHGVKKRLVKKININKKKMNKKKKTKCMG